MKTVSQDEVRVSNLRRCLSQTGQTEESQMDRPRSPNWTGRGVPIQQPRNPKWAGRGVPSQQPRNPNWAGRGVSSQQPRNPNWAGRGVSKRDETMMFPPLRSYDEAEAGGGDGARRRQRRPSTTASDDDARRRAPGGASVKARGKIRRRRSPTHERPADVDVGRMDSRGENRANRAGNDAGGVEEGKEAPSEGAG